MNGWRLLSVLPVVKRPRQPRVRGGRLSLKKFLINQYEKYKKSSDEYFLPEALFLAQCSKLELNFIEGCDALGIALAKLYNNRTIDYVFGDIVANDMSAYMLSFVHDKEGQMWANHLWEVYEAFDAGEYYRTDNQEDDPVKEHTDPMIVEFLDKIS